VRGFIISNINFQNINFVNYLFGLIKECGFDYLPIYVNENTKLFFSYLNLDFGNNLISVSEDRDIKIGDFFINFLFIGSNFLGNFAFSINFLEKYSFYFFESFSFTNTLENDLIFPEISLDKFQKFLTPANEKIYLVSSCQGMH
jgi:hypothetical protein